MQIIHFILINNWFTTRFQSEEGVHFKSSNNLKKCGNFYYVSHNALLGNPISRKDYLINVSYLLLVWCYGCLWNNISFKDSIDIRKNILDSKKILK